MKKQQQFQVFAVLDPSLTPPTLLAVSLTRAKARFAASVMSIPPSVTVLIRRCKLVVFED